MRFIVQEQRGIYIYVRDDGVVDKAGALGMNLTRGRLAGQQGSGEAGVNLLICCRDTIGLATVLES